MQSTSRLAGSVTLIIIPLPPHCRFERFPCPPFCSRFSIPQPCGLAHCPYPVEQVYGTHIRILLHTPRIIQPHQSHKTPLDHTRCSQAVHFEEPEEEIIRTTHKKGFSRLFCVWCAIRTGYQTTIGRRAPTTRRTSHPGNAPSAFETQGPCRFRSSPGLLLELPKRGKCGRRQQKTSTPPLLVHTVAPASI